MVVIALLFLHRYWAIFIAKTLSTKVILMFLFDYIYSAQPGGGMVEFNTPKA